RVNATDADATSRCRVTVDTVVHGQQRSRYSLKESLPLIVFSTMGNEGEVTLIQNSDDLKNKLKDAGNNLVIIDFFAVWCGPCKMIGPLIEELSKEMQDVVFLKVDVDECEDIAAEYEISSMPTFVFIKEVGDLFRCEFR
ncbi:Thioredoxin, partial [Temnothorax longispinosus]